MLKYTNAMFSKNVLYIFKTFQSVRKRNIWCHELNPITSELYKFINRSVILAANKKFMHSSSNCFSEKSNEKPQYKVKKIVTEDGIVKIQKKIYIPRITLFTSENGMEIVTLVEAQKIAARRNLKLIQIADIDPKTDRPIYKLSSVSEENTKNKKDKNKNVKEEKILSINSNISEHDLQSKLRNILKWLQKGYTVKVSISGDVKNAAPSEKIYNTISEGIENVGRIVQKSFKNGEIKFHIILPKKKIESLANKEDKLEGTEESK